MIICHRLASQQRRKRICTFVQGYVAFEIWRAAFENERIFQLVTWMGGRRRRQRKKTDDEIRWKHVPVIVLLINNFIRTTHSPNPTPFYRIENLIVTPLSWIQCQSGVGNGQNRSIFLRRPGEFRWQLDVQASRVEDISYATTSSIFLQKGIPSLSLLFASCPRCTVCVRPILSSSWFLSCHILSSVNATTVLTTGHVGKTTM